VTNRVVVDASALAALTFREPDGDAIGTRLQGAEVFAPALLKFEMANIAWKKARREPEDAAAIAANLNAAVSDRSGIAWHDVDVADVVLVAQALGVTAYDASYLWLAGFLGADLVTLDQRLARLSEAMAT
jgi:predicted nucleic acid-binding protein